MNTIEITTPPISVNKMYRGRRFWSKEGLQTKNSIAWEVKAQYNGKVREDDIALNVLFFVKNDCADIDNMLKATLDCMSGLVYKDDKQIKELHVFKQVDKKNPRTVIQIL